MDWPCGSSELTEVVIIHITTVRICIFLAIPCAALLIPYFFVTEWISAMYPPGNLTRAASRSSVL